MCFQVNDYVDKCYQDTYVNCYYQHVIYRVNVFGKPIKRPKKSRNKSGNEISSNGPQLTLSREGQQQKCSYCFGLGHNKRTCPKKRKVEVAAEKKQEQNNNNNVIKQKQEQEQKQKQEQNNNNETIEPPEIAITTPIRHHSATTLFFFSLRATLAPPSQRDLFSSLGSPPKSSPSCLEPEPTAIEHLRRAQRSSGEI
ncbi:hypothetical protein Ahy_B02g058140 [Arachis hypogaea]|uniref:CCHC-type domain-containing protein n=1 Tax=Arachis hypogaea TaxID=3818 RepID=A0A445ADX3_ARAHY|nr:hypothetical protein Ahy_B02g058140 [Arachis hypogaea]